MRAWVACLPGCFCGHGLWGGVLLQILENHRLESSKTECQIPRKSSMTILEKIVCPCQRGMFDHGSLWDGEAQNVSSSPRKRMPAPAASTVTSFLDMLESMYVIESLHAWDAPVRAKSRLRTKPKRYFADLSIPAAALGMGPERLLSDGCVPSRLRFSKGRACGSKKGLIGQKGRQGSPCRPRYTALTAASRDGASWPRLRLRRLPPRT